MDHGHAHEDLGVIVATFLIADVERPQTPFGGLECIDPGRCSLANGGDFSSGSIANGFFLSFELLDTFRVGLGHGIEHTIKPSGNVNGINSQCAVPSLLRKRIARSKSNNSRNSNSIDSCNRKGSPRLAIVHVVMKSSSQAPPAAAHAEYIARDGQYQQRGGLELVESGNMPEFARENPHSFWEAADAFERKNGRAYTELQIALPRELAPEQRTELAREATRELLGDRFAYTMAVHTPLAKDNIEQPHMHLMFSERAIDERTRELSEEQFFKRNGAKKDPEWNAREKPMEVREKWVEMMNAAMERHGQEQRLDPRSWADQGRHDLAELVEPKLLAGSEAEARALHAHVDGLREQRAELPAAHLSPDKVIDHWEQHAEEKIAQVREREAQELSRLDRLIAAAKELASAVKEKTVEVARTSPIGWSSCAIASSAGGRTEPRMRTKS